MGFDRQQLEAALQEVTEHLSLQVKLQGTGQPQGIPLHLFETLPSTNQTLWKLLDRGATTGTTVCVPDSGISL
jgi:BirA family biotin operon repressor/biotin-[acetyl-CoA-carboxylase] ligase